MEAYELMRILNKFSKASSKRINLQKSSLVFSRKVPTFQKSQICQILNIPCWDSPRKYLRLTAHWGRSKKSTLAQIKEAALGKIEGQKEKLHNTAGKEVLIKVVIQATPSYAMAILKIPKGSCENLYPKVARFWWSKNGRDTGIYWRSRNLITKAKKDGRLRFKDFTYLNIALLAK